MMPSDPDRVLSSVPSAGHFNQALPGHFCVAPKCKMSASGLSLLTAGLDRELSVINRPTRVTSVPSWEAIFFSSRTFSGGVGSIFGPRSWQSRPGAEPPWLRFCLSHFRQRRTTSKPSGRRRTEVRSFADVRSVCAIRSSAMAAEESRHMTKITIGYRPAAAFVIAAARHSLSCRHSLHLTATTA